MKKNEAVEEVKKEELMNVETLETENTENKEEIQVEVKGIKKIGTSIKNFGKKVGKGVKKHGKTFLKVTGGVLAGAAIATAVCLGLAKNPADDWDTDDCSEDDEDMIDTEATEVDPAVYEESDEEDETSEE